MAKIVPLLLIAAAAYAQLERPTPAVNPNSISVVLASPSGTTTYRAGDRITVQLTFLSSGVATEMNGSDYGGPTGLEKIVIAPSNGAVAWAGDQSGTSKYFPDYFMKTPLSATHPVHLNFVLNEIYRFDPGHYTVHILTRRIGNVGELTSNDLNFEVEPFPPAQEAALADSLESKIRAASSQPAANKLAKNLDYLTGDASIRAKLNLYLHPKTFYPFGVDVSEGLAIARNRQLVVDDLREALTNPNQEVDSTFVDMLSRFQYSMQAPEPPDARFGPARPPSSPLLIQIRAENLHLLAETLPRRSGESRMAAAETIFTADAHATDTTAIQDFAIAREALITHFSEVNEYNVQSYLQSFGPQLDDPRLLPALQTILNRHEDGNFSGNRLGALMLLNRIDPLKLPAALTVEACQAHPILLHQLADLASSIETLPGADACLLELLRSELSVESHPLDVTWTMQWIARFASAALVPEVRRDLDDHPEWQPDSRGAALTYLMRWDPEKTRPLLESFVPAKHDAIGVLGLLEPAHPPDQELRTFFLDRLKTDSPAVAGTDAYALSRLGNSEDREFLRQQLTAFRRKVAGQFSPEDGRLEMELVEAVMHGLAWSSTQAESKALAETCVSAECRKHFSQ